MYPREKVTVCILKPYGEIMCSPFEMLHGEKELNALDDLLNKLDGEIRIVMEATGIYHLPILTFFHEKRIFRICYKSIRNEEICKGQQYSRCKNRQT